MFWGILVVGNLRKIHSGLLYALMYLSRIRSGENSPKHPKHPKVPVYRTPRRGVYDVVAGAVMVVPVSG